MAPSRWSRISPIPEAAGFDSRPAFASFLSPFVRLIGHALAAGLGFCALALISLIPILTVKALLWLGLAELAVPLRALEIGLLITDIVLFGVVLGTGVVVFAVESLAMAWRRLKSVWKEKRT